MAGTLYLYIFRGEPAIPRFVRHITPNLKSSHWIETQKSSGLLPYFYGVHPAQGYLTGLRALYIVQNSPYSGLLSLRLRY